jgi:hypothetical protein
MVVMGGAGAIGVQNGSWSSPRTVADGGDTERAEINRRKDLTHRKSDSDNPQMILPLLNQTTALMSHANHHSLITPAYL